MSDKNRQKEQDTIESVGIVIRTKDGSAKDIPLEVWQVGAIAMELGLQVKLPNLNDYKMTDEELYHKRKKQELCAIKYFLRKTNEHLSQILSEYSLKTNEEFFIKKREDAELDVKQITKIETTL